MYGRPARQHALPRIHTESELIKYMRRKQAADTAETHYVTAESHVPELRVGSVVRLYSSFLERVGQLTRESLGDFIITEIVHEVGEGSYYRNRFKAIPSTVEALPSPRVPMPVAETQMATVTSNADPKGNGRVQVRMNWQQGDMHTGWVRVMTPDAGKSGDVSSNRGFVFIPEVGDQVLLGFRHGDPARPYVMGSLFNGSTGGGGGQGNKCKSLTTRSGSSLKLDDSDGSVTLHDKGGVSMNFDGAGNSTLNSNTSHTVNAGSNASTNVGEGASVLNMNSGGCVELTSQSEVSIKVGSASISMNNSSITLSIGSSSITLTSENILSKGTTLSMESTTSTSISGGQNIDISATQNHIGGETKMDGGDVFVN
ncbi:type IV secretion protein Rhs [Prevotella intermedia]|uniref:Type IV secretion protein Rhs n=3 Tax=Prevotella TaxID=838 RepID=A0A424Z5B6_PREIN|nr:type IV secretion protein Rhs [Prevotella intermedia]RRF86421.1 type IV secretion protein Rhs [Prevotella intermedia]